MNVTPGQVICTSLRALLDTDGEPFIKDHTWARLNDRERAGFEETAQAVLSSQWRDPSQKPSEDDWSADDLVLTQSKDGIMRFFKRYENAMLNRDWEECVARWMCVPTPPEPTEEEKIRAEFEAWAKTHPCIHSEHYPTTAGNFAFEAYKAGKTSKP